VKARPGDRNFAGNGQRQAFTPALILFIALPETKDNCQPVVIPLDLLPRECPCCRRTSIIGHGRRLRTAHDERQEAVWVRRGRCRPCRKTFTVLPVWLLPFGHYSLRCRQQACERLAAGATAEQAAPDCQDATRLPDPATLRRWAKRRVLSVWCGLTVFLDHFFEAPTIFAWDLIVVCRILPFEARSP
jgi:hypothetical protein